jgi:hypothetical protein
MFHGDPRPSVDASTRPAMVSAASLRELAELLPARADGDRLSLEGLRTAAKRAGFPAALDGTEGAGRTALYPVDDVFAWFRDRERLAIDV